MNVFSEVFWESGMTFFYSADLFLYFYGLFFEILVFCENHAINDSFFYENEVFVFEVVSKHNWDEIFCLVVHYLCLIVSLMIEMNRSNLNERYNLTILLRLAPYLEFFIMLKRFVELQPFKLYVSN